MKQKLLNIKSLFILLGVGFFVGGLLLFVSAQVKSLKELPHVDFASISGLSEDDEVSYQVLSGEHNLSSRAIESETKNDFRIPLFDESYDQKILYDLNIKHGGKPLNVRLLIDRVAKEMKISGSGLEKFSQIEIRKDQNILNAKSDWSGAFEFSPLDISEQDDFTEAFKIALFNNNVMSDILTDNPLIIEVIETSGGGGRDDDGVNEWDLPDNCGRGGSRRQLSICNQSNTNSQIDRLVDTYVSSLMWMTEQLNAVAMQYVQIIGTFMDAKIQMKTQRTMQTLQAQAHKDYHPSEQMCVIGSFVKSVAVGEQKARYDHQAFNKAMMDRYANAAYPPGYQGVLNDVEARLRQFRTTYCDPTDNNGALVVMCQHDFENPKVLPGEASGAENPDRVNIDIDYQRLVDYPLTIDADFTEPPAENELATDYAEQDLIALARNLYWPNILNVVEGEDLAEKPDEYINARSIMAMHNVAHNTLAHIISIKAQSPEGLGEESGWSFMKAFMRDFGISDDEIVETLGERPSYNAQMEILTKKLYHSPEFYTNLYDKPANVDRISASLEAIKLMQMRDWYQTATRREMLSSLLVEEGLAKHVQAVNGRIPSTAAK